MSKLKHFIELKAPETNKEKVGEVFTVGGLTCGHCDGQKYFLPTEIGHNKFEENPCPVCKGTGKMQAKVVVGWLPDNI